jgi:hypothetical protein
MNRPWKWIIELLKSFNKLVSGAAFDFPGGLRCLLSLNTHLSKRKNSLIFSSHLFEKEKEKVS